MNTIDISRKVVSLTAADLTKIADSLAQADNYLQTWVQTDSTGGFFLASAGSAIKHVREELSGQYVQPGIKQILDDAGIALDRIWKDFEQSDREAKERLEKNPLPSLPPLFPGHQPPATPREPTLTSKVDSFSRYFTDPVGDMSGIELLNHWRDLKDKVDTIVGFEWVTGPLEHVGIHSPIDRFKNHMEGNYEEWATGAAAIRSLGDYWEQICTDMVQIEAQMSAYWFGDGAQAVSSWMASFYRAASDHEIAINLWAGKIEIEIVNCKLWLDIMIDLLEDLVDLIPIWKLNGDGLIDKGISLLKSAGKNVARAIVAAIRIVTKLFAKFELLLGALLAFVTLVSQGVRDLAFPYVTPVKV